MPTHQVVPTFFLWSTLILVISVRSFSCPCRSTFSSQDVTINYALQNHVIEQVEVTDVGQCFHVCVFDDRCLSFNFKRQGRAWLCEMSDRDRHTSPYDIVPSPGVDYYEITDRPQESHFKSCACRKYDKLHCACEDGYLGNHCDTEAHSCLDYLRNDQSQGSGLYKILDDNGYVFPVFCDISVLNNTAWTLVLSYALKNNNEFNTTPFFMNKSLKEHKPNWSLYRLPLAKMHTIRKSSQFWRVSCNYSTLGIDKRDYAIARWKDIDLLNLNGYGCKRFAYINIRGSHCVNCTTWVHQGDKTSRMFLVSAPFGSKNHCELRAPPEANPYEESFGYYGTIDPRFRCTTNEYSTTQFWFGGAL